MTHSANKHSSSTQVKNHHYDYLIIGQGLAGSLLAWEMIQQGQRVLVLDNQHSGSATKVAAGIINPITGHRVNLTEDFSTLIDTAKRTYESLNTQLKLENPIFSNIPQQRLIKNPGQQKYYQKRLQQSEYQHFIKPATEDNFYQFKNPEYGIGHIQQTYRVDTHLLLASLKEFLKNKHCLIETKLCYDNLAIENDHIKLQQDDTKISANSIIFCEGFQAIHNPWLKDLPFKLAKGDILSIELDRECPSLMNWGNWLLPNQKSNQTALLGSTYAWNDTQLEIKQQSADVLFSSLEKHTQFKGKLLNHRTGIRPTTINRKPLVGVHPEHANLYCFNGFGSKGCLSVPYYAKHFAKHFVEDTPLERLFPEIPPILPLLART